MVTNVFEDAPLLKEIVLWGFSTHQFKFNWSSLTVLSLRQQEDRKETLAVLRATINLVELTIKKPDYLDPNMAHYTT